MTTSEKKIAAYLHDARSMERGLVRTLQEQIAMAPRGRYRDALQRHLRETRRHVERISTRLDELHADGGGIGALAGRAQDAAVQMLALAKLPLDIVRGSAGEEKVLTNAKDACATEAREIATYIALEQLARAVGDTRTAELATAIRGDEEAMLERVRNELPALTAAVVRSDVEGRSTYDVTESGAADAVRQAASDVKRAAGSTAARAGRQARRVPGVARAEGVARGAIASAEDLPIPNYDERTAEQIAQRLPELSQLQLHIVDAYERKNQGRSGVLDRIAALRGDEPWSGYDESNADEVVERLRAGDDALATQVRDYERAHKGRTTVLRAAERELASV